MRLSIVTPCLNSDHYIGRCLASVSDQKEVDVEHIVQDGGSTDRSLQIIQGHQNVILFSEPDNGMYDALNRGFDRASGDVFAHINCDEQYLPGALNAVVRYFEEHDDVDILFTDVLVLKDDASFVCYQKVIKPTRTQTVLSHLATYTAGTFFRRRVWESGCRFDTTKKALGDSWWMLHALDAKFTMVCMRHYTTAVTATQSNVSLSEVAKTESQALYKSAGKRLKAKWLMQFMFYRLSKLLHGCYWQGPLVYSVYNLSDPSSRHDYYVRLPLPFWVQMRTLKTLDYYTGRP